MSAMDPLRFLRVHRVPVFIVNHGRRRVQLVVFYEIGSIVGGSVKQKKTPDILVDAGRSSGRSVVAGRASSLLSKYRRDRRH